MNNSVANISNKYLLLLLLLLLTSCNHPQLEEGELEFLEYSPSELCAIKGQVVAKDTSLYTTRYSCRPARSGAERCQITAGQQAWRIKFELNNYVVDNEQSLIYDLSNAYDKCY